MIVVSETAPQDDLSVCYYDCKQGEMIGSLLCTKSLKKVHEGDIIEMKIDFSFGLLCFSVNQVIEVRFDCLELILVGNFLNI